MTSPYEVVALLAAGFFYILSAGGYAFFYTYGRLRNEEKYKYVSFVFMGIMLYCAYVMISSQVFVTFWKALLSFATVAYIFIPHGMWWVVVRVHRTEEEERQRSL
jgi:hypothetical protein